MERVILSDLEKWLGGSERQPLVLRGARQVGKTWLVRELAGRAGLDLVEINFERDPTWADCFSDNDPNATISRIGLRLGRIIDPETCLLFLDEIQEFGEGLAKLRWFYEELPELPVVAAGSLLEFGLRDHDFSMPVGRIVFLNASPLGFDEFLRAHRMDSLLDCLSQWAAGDKVLDRVVHTQASAWFERFAMVGGMPGIVQRDLDGETSQEIRDAQRQLSATYRADFPKYAGRTVANTIDRVLLSVLSQIGQKFVYSRVSDGVKQHQVKAALEVLTQARVCRCVSFSAANGVPLAAEVKSKFRKFGFLDVGLLHALADTPALPVFPAISGLESNLRSKISEQMVTQQLGLIGSNRGDPQQLYYWQREGGRPGEIDHLLQISGRIFPLELKSGAAGSMKSLHQFMFDKHLSRAVRIDLNPPSVQGIALKTNQGNPVSYELVSVPPYLLWNLEFILAESLRLSR